MQLLSVHGAFDASLPVLCEVAARCGGCPQIGTSTTVQWNSKAERLRQAMLSQGLCCPEPKWLAAQSEGYRNRIRLQLIDGEPAFFNREKSRHCAVLQPELRHVLDRFFAWAVAHRDWLSAFRVAELRVPDADGMAGLYLRRTTAPRVQAYNSGEGCAGRSSLPPPFEGVYVACEDGVQPTQRFVLPGNCYVRVPVGAFMQVHTAANALMVQQVVSWTAALGCRTFADLFAGSGNFTVPLAAMGCAGVAVERDGGAVAALQVALDEQGVNQVFALCANALAYAEQRVLGQQRVDLVIVDPPRAGLRRRVRDVASLARTAVVLACCSVEAFAQDASALLELGLVCEQVRLIDMFPHTQHVEVLGLFIPTRSDFQLSGGSRRV